MKSERFTEEQIISVLKEHEVKLFAGHGVFLGKQAHPKQAFPSIFDRAVQSMGPRPA